MSAVDLSAPEDRSKLPAMRDYHQRAPSRGPPPGPRGLPAPPRRRSLAVRRLSAAKALLSPSEQPARPAGPGLARAAARVAPGATEGVCGSDWG